MKEDESKVCGLPAQLLREVLRAAATGANEIPASQFVMVPGVVAAWLLSLLNRHPDEQVRSFFLHELETMVEVGENGEAVVDISSNAFAGVFSGDWPVVDFGEQGDAEPGKPEYPAEAAGHWDRKHRRFRVDSIIRACPGRSLN